MGLYLLKEKCWTVDPDTVCSASNQLSGMQLAK